MKIITLTTLYAVIAISILGQGIPPSAQWIVPDGQWGVGNSDQDCIRLSNTYYANGALNLVANQQTGFCAGGTTYGGTTQPFTVGGMEALTFNFTYGVVKVRAKLPGVGVHAGIWLLSAACQATQTGGDAGVPCPGHPEVDILDYLPLQFGSTSGVCGYFDGSTWHQPTYTFDPTQWHVYSLLWNSSGLTWQLDGVTQCTYSPGPTSAMYPWLTVEVDGTTSGRAPSYPITMFVDYERICSDPTASCGDGDPTMIFQDEFGGPLNSSALHGGAALHGMAALSH